MNKLPFPADALNQHAVVLGKTRSGKSSKLRLCVEYLLDKSEPVTIIDPKGDWWGLKSSASGKEAGYPLIIFGGDHADVPINEHSGAHIAELIATGNRPCLIDLGGWRVKHRTQFFINFCETIFKLTRGRRWLVIDECHNFVPKGRLFDPQAAEMLHWGNRLASEGQGKGLNLLSASQRPQKVHNDYLTSHETLIACRVVHKADRDALKDWIDGCADAAVGKEMIGTLAGMKRTEAWVWSPEIGFGPARTPFPMFKTYDSFRPQPSDGGKLKGWAEVDLDDVRAKLAAVVEEAEANDPAKLKAEIATLKKQLSAASKPDGKINTAADDVVALHDREAAFAAGKREGRGEGYLQGWADGEQSGFVRGVNAMDKEAIHAFEQREVPSYEPSVPPKKIPESGGNYAKPMHAPVAQGLERAAHNGLAAGSNPAGRTISGDEISPSARKILQVIHASFPVPLSFDAAARRATISKRSSAFRKYRDQVMASGEIVSDGGLLHSAEGFGADVPEAGAGVEAWLNKVPKNCAKILGVLADNRAGLDRREISTLAGISATSSGLTSGLKLLCNLELIRQNGGQYQICDGL